MFSMQIIWFLIGCIAWLVISSDMGRMTFKRAILLKQSCKELLTIWWPTEYANLKRIGR